MSKEKIAVDKIIQNVYDAVYDMLVHEGVPMFPKESWDFQNKCCSELSFVGEKEDRMKICKECKILRSCWLFRTIMAYFLDSVDCNRPKELVMNKIMNIIVLFKATSKTDIGILPSDN